MNEQDLKNSILQLAIQGKLVEQRSEEGTAKELLEQIKAEKGQHIKEKKIKKEKPLAEITEAEIPFDIPESWAWVRLGEVAFLNSGGQYDESNSGLLYIKVADMNLENNKYEITTSTRRANCPINSVIPKGSIIFPKRGGAILTNKKRLVLKSDICVDSNTMAMTVINLDCLDYIYTWFNGIDLGRLATGTSVPQINNKDIYPLLLPLPPLEEQKRIVAKIEELMPYVEKYGEAHSELVAFNKKFPEDMQKSILQYAIQGKLVEQRKEEGTAEELYKLIQEEKARLIKEGKIKKEKPLPDITEDEVPFEIPESWKWVRLGNLCEKIGSGSTPTGGKSVYKESGIKFLRSQNIYNDGLRLEGVAFISDEQNKQGSIVKPKDILLNITGGSIGRSALVPDDFDIANINQHVMIIRNLVSENRFLLHYILISPYVQSMIMSVQVGVSREGLSAEKLKNFLIPLAPHKEQKRIVAKIEEMLPYCQQLVK